MNVKMAEVLQRLEEIRNNDNPRWNIPRDAGIFLNTLIKATQAKFALEIGTSNGYSGIWLAEGLKHTGGKLITVESHAGRFEEAKSNFAEAGVSEQIEQVLGHAPEAVESLEIIFDLMFFDATKNEHLKYFDKLAPKLKKYGLIITDNIVTHAEELKTFMETLEANPQYQTTRLNIGSGFLVSLKLAD